MPLNTASVAAGPGMRRLSARLALRLLPHTLLNRVFLLFAATLSVILVTGTVMALRDHVEGDIEDANSTATMLVELAAQSVADAVLVNDHDAIRRTLRAAVLRTPFERARFIELNGNVADERAPKLERTQAPALLRGYMARRLPEVNRVVNSGGRDYGVLRLDFQIDRLAEPIWHSTLRSLGLALTGLLGGLMLTRVLLTRWLSHLGKLDDLVKSIQGGELDAQAAADVDAPLEVRRALEQFNSATGGLRDRFGQRIDALNRSLEQHKRATDQAVIVVELDRDGKVSAVNDLFCAVSGRSREAMLGRTGVWSLQPALYIDHCRNTPGDPVWHGEVACRTAAGDTVWVKRAVVPIVGERSDPQKYICLDIDITREKAAEATLHAEKERAEVTLHSIADGVLTVDAQGLVGYANPAARRMLGLSNSPIEGRALDQMLRIVPRTRESQRARSDGSREQIVLLPDGRRAVIDISSAPLHGVDGRHAGDVIALRDVTDEHRARQELKRLSLAVQYAASAILITDPQGRIEYVNPTFTRMTGYAFDEVRGKTPSLLRSADVPRQTYEAMWNALNSGQTWRGELANRRKDGSNFWSALTLSTVLDSAGRVRQFISVMEDASERKAAEETIHRLAYYDTLTALPNRRMFMERAVEAVKAARGQGVPLAMCYLDLDGFKNINDTLGHQLGDVLLTEAGNRIKACLSPEDFLGRLGGDEFALLLHEAGNRKRIRDVGQAIIASLEGLTELEGEEIRIGTSIGISVFPEDGSDVTELLRKADMALYRAKDLGKHQLVFFTDEIEAHKRRRAEMEAALAAALPGGQLQLLYQPKIDLDTQAVVGAEALIRWRHPGLGLVRPDQFIPMAEETRLILPIGEWIIEEACRQLNRWTDEGLGHVNLAVNLSSVQFRVQDLADRIERIVRRSGVDPSRLELEITESGLMEDPDGAVRILGRLRAIGLTIAIDDFGTGYSSLAYLKSFPVCTLKIDRSFVRDLEADVNDRGIAEAVISMSRVLRVAVVAEGVESAGQVDILRAMGCQFAQGFYFSKPITAEQFTTYWWRHREQSRYLPTVPADLDVI